MNRSASFFLLLLVALAGSAFAADRRAAAEAPPAVSARGGMQWLPFPDPQLELRGLPWFAENAPELWRLPKTARARIPNGAWNRAVAPDGGRIRFSCPTSRLALRVQIVSTQKKRAHFDAYIDDRLAGSASAMGPGPAELLLFDDHKPGAKNVTIYLPNTTEVRLLAVGVDAGAAVQPPPPFALKTSIVCYGSSVLQGTGADHASRTYPAVLARRLNVDFVNLGFGGAGKAEPAVVELVSQPDACCYIFDLGKSYGNQPKEPFARMLATIRAARPTVPIVCVTPIFSMKEIGEPEYRERSEKLRDLMRDAALERQRGGDELTFVAEGLDLFGPADKALFRDPLHPNDEGNELMAERLAPTIKRLIFGAK
ncbi:MAG: SGNH/GDSL hydrolase family protein [Opitutaceae bacterium]|nr:SGNH/GDSL hydrolase family protein [Opitutaceae bacterium]